MFFIVKSFAPKAASVLQISRSFQKKKTRRQCKHRDHIFFIKVLSCDTFANVLYLDSGGTELVLPHSLYKILPMHCNYPPMCMQLCMYGVGPSSADTSTDWPEGAKTLWRKLLREDLPMAISVISKTDHLLFQFLLNHIDN
ncbi:unnamed protein product [Haemonchus placei]|uniref:Tudor domain-containing protein n=1 Tax=Haemonchus placei TaxID=6290 RepID=A0A158QKE4_HAEPC|nr:unnamed protein product [Haemonchus placei]